MVEERTVVPELSFPAFPLAKSGEIRDNGDGTATVSAEWLVRLEEYHIRIGATEAEWKRLREIYGGE